MSVPNRPGIIIREPERERKRGNKPMEMDSAIGSKIDPTIVENMKKKTELGFTLYTNFSRCRYSQEIVNAANERHLNFTVKDVDALSAPRWLPGTPSVVYGENVYCGDAAFKFVETHHNKPEDPERHCTKAKINDETLGCDFASAFSAPIEIVDDDKKYDVSTDEMMQRIMHGRR